MHEVEAERLPASARCAGEIAIQAGDREVRDLREGELGKQLDLHDGSLSAFVESDVHDVVEVPPIFAERVDDASDVGKPLEEQAQGTELGEGPAFRHQESKRAAVRLSGGFLQK